MWTIVAVGSGCARATAGAPTSTSDSTAIAGRRYAVMNTSLWRGPRSSRRPACARYQCLLAAAITIALGARAAAQEPAAPCAACVVVAVAPDESYPLDAAGLPAAIVIP